MAVNFKSWIGGIADVDGYSKHNILGTGVGGSLSTYLSGPRVSVNRYARFTPFAQVLAGIGHTGGRYLTTGRQLNCICRSDWRRA